MTDETKTQPLEPLPKESDFCDGEGEEIYWEHYAADIRRIAKDRGRIVDLLRFEVAASHLEIERLTAADENAERWEAEAKRLRKVADDEIQKAADGYLEVERLGGVISSKDEVSEVRRLKLVEIAGAFGMLISNDEEDLADAARRIRRERDDALRRLVSANDELKRIAGMGCEALQGPRKSFGERKPCGFCRSCFARAAVTTVPQPADPGEGKSCATRACKGRATGIQTYCRKCLDPFAGDDPGEAVGERCSLTDCQIRVPRGGERCELSDCRLRPEPVDMEESDE